jgi:hydrogenase expression/formation protein HypC
VTCSDEGRLGQVVSLVGEDRAVIRAQVCGGGETQLEVSVALVTAQPGDWVVVHAGEAIALLPPGDARPA